MERETIYFLVLIGIILSSNGIFFYAERQSDKEMQADYTAKFSQLAAALAQTRQDYDQKINQHSLELTKLDDKIESATSEVKSELKSNVQNIQTSLKTVEQESQQKISQLESQLLKINIRSQDFTSVIKDSIDSVVSIQTDVGGGSGVIVDSRGYIVTNLHVVNGATVVQVKTFKQKVFPAALVGHNSRLDLAVLKIDDGSFEALKWGSSTNVEIGEKIIAIGSPGGLDFTVTEGIVSAKRKDSKGIDYLQIDVPVNPGNSGGPIVSSEGKIVGITQIKISEFEGIGFAIASNDVDD